MAEDGLCFDINHQPLNCPLCQRVYTGLSSKNGSNDNTNNKDKQRILYCENEHEWYVCDNCENLLAHKRIGGLGSLRFCTNCGTQQGTVQHFRPKGGRHMAKVSEKGAWEWEDEPLPTLCPLCNKDYSSTSSKDGSRDSPQNLELKRILSCIEQHEWYICNSCNHLIAHEKMGPTGINRHCTNCGTQQGTVQRTMMRQPVVEH